MTFVMLYFLLDFPVIEPQVSHHDFHCIAMIFIAHCTIQFGLLLDNKICGQQRICRDDQKGEQRKA